MKRVRKGDPVGKLFPHAGARAAADEAVDVLPVTSTMAEYLDAWENRYFEVAGDSPFREGVT